MKLTPRAKNICNLSTYKLDFIYVNVAGIKS